MLQSHYHVPLCSTWITKYARSREVRSCVCEPDAKILDEGVFIDAGTRSAGEGEWSLSHVQHTHRPLPEREREREREWFSGYDSRFLFFVLFLLFVYLFCVCVRVGGEDKLK